MLNYPNHIINTLECGYNARDTIINYCKEGHIIIAESSIGISKIVDCVEIKAEGHRFNNIDELNRFIKDYYSMRSKDYKEQL